MTCAVCGGEGYASTRWTNVLDTGANLVECAECGVRFYDRPELMHVPAAEFYNSDRYDAYIDRHVNNGSPFMNSPEKRGHYEKTRNNVYGRIVENLRLVTSPLDRLYEIGASWGLFLDVAEKRGVVGTGCDMSKRAVERSGGRVEHCPFLGAKIDAPVDAVVSLDVIEHTETPGADMARAFDILRPGGAFVVKTFYDEWHDTAEIDLGKPAPTGLPNFNNYLKAGYFGRSHLHHFTTDALRRALRRAGFNVIDETHHKACGQVEMYGVRP